MTKALKPAIGKTILALFTALALAATMVPLCFAEKAHAADSKLINIAIEITDPPYVGDPRQSTEGFKVQSLEPANSVAKVELRWVATNNTSHEKIMPNYEYFPCIIVEPAPGYTLNGLSVGLISNPEESLICSMYSGNQYYFNYSEKTFHRRSVGKLKVTPNVRLSYASKAYTGKVIENPSVVSVRAAGAELSPNRYNVIYSSPNPIKVGKYSVTVILKGGYEGSTTTTFTINPKKPGIKKLTAAKKAFKIQVAKQPAGTTSGYEVSYKIKGKAKWSTKSFNSKAALSKSVSKLTSKKTYQVRVRTYQAVGKEKVFSEYSATKTVKVK